jgi:hypothetical protein
MKDIFEQLFTIVTADTNTALDNVYFYETFSLCRKDDNYLSSFRLEILSG